MSKLRLRLYPPLLQDPETRRRKLGLTPDIDRRDRQWIAARVLFGEPLEDHERKFVARLVDSGTVTLLTGVEPSKRGRSVSTDVAVRRDEVAEYYFFQKAMHPHAKHKQQLLPNTAKALGVSTSSVDKALGRTDPERLRQMEVAARDFVKGVVEARLHNALVGDYDDNWALEMSKMLHEPKRKRSKTRS
jgi:hypothetical protein